MKSNSTVFMIFTVIILTITLSACAANAASLNGDAATQSIAGESEELDGENADPGWDDADETADNGEADRARNEPRIEGTLYQILYADIDGDNADEQVIAYGQSIGDGLCQLYIAAYASNGSLISETSLFDPCQDGASAYGTVCAVDKGGRRGIYVERVFFGTETLAADYAVLGLDGGSWVVQKSARNPGYTDMVGLEGVRSPEGPEEVLYEDYDAYAYYADDRTLKKYENAISGVFAEYGISFCVKTLSFFNYGEWTDFPCVTIDSNEGVRLLPGAPSGSKPTSDYSYDEPAASETRVKASGGNSNVRTGPGLDYGQIGVMTKGDVAEYEGEKSFDERGVCWYRIRFQGESGWVSSKYTTLS